MSAVDLLGMAAGFCLILAITLVNSYGRILWEDEVLAWVLLRDPSWHHMIHAWNLGADGGGFTFYVLGRVWFRIFGCSEIAFRLFTSVCFGFSFLVTWTLLRRFYPVWIVAFAAFNTMFFSPPLTMHYVEGRFYGLLVLETAAALWLVVRLTELPTLPLRFYMFVFLVHSALVTTHVLGILYSAVFLIAMIVVDRLHGRSRTLLYWFAAASWLWLVPERKALLATSQVGKPHFWTKAPTMGQIIGAYSGSSLEILAVLLLLTLGAALTLPRSPGDLLITLQKAMRDRLALYVGAGCLLFVPLGLLLVGTVSTWLFVDRYLQPVTLALAYVTAELLLLAVRGSSIKLFRRKPRFRSATCGVLALGFSAFLFFWVFVHMSDYTPAVGDFTPQLTALLPRDIPVVVTDAFTFTELMYRQGDSGIRFEFPLDWPYALSAGAPRLEVTQYHLMENWKRAGIFADHVAYLGNFIHENDRFLVVSNQPIGTRQRERPEVGNPIAERLATTPGFKVMPLFTLDRLYKDSQRDTVWLVCRGSCKPYPIRQGANHCALTGETSKCLGLQECLR